MKRILDILIATTLMLIFLPLGGILAFIIWFETGLNPIFIQRRGITFEKGVFRIYKLRTMYAIPAESKGSDRCITEKSWLEKYITPVGKWLRKTGIDELPQLLNVIKGDMSFVGPRPLQESDLQLLKVNYPELYAKRSSLKSKPGITGYWQIFGDRAAGAQNIVELDFYYEQNHSFWMDIFIGLETLPVILFARHFDAVSFERVRKIEIKEIPKW